MKESVRSCVLAGSLVVILASTVLSALQIQTVRGNLASMFQILEDQQEEETKQIMEELSQDVTRPNGDVVHVRIERQAGETVAEFVARFDALVAALKEDG